MRKRLYFILHHPRLVASRRWLVLWLVFIMLAVVAGQVERWEEDFHGFWLLHILLYLLAGLGIVVVPVLAGVVELRAWRRLKATGARPPLADWRRGWWDMWLLGLVLLVSLVLGRWYDVQAEARSELCFSCSGAHGEHVFARAMWQSRDARVEEIAERLPRTAGHLHTLYLPDGDYSVVCQTGSPAFYISLNRGAYSFNLRLQQEEGPAVQYRLCRLRSDEERFRVMHQLEQGGKYSRWLQEMPFYPCVAEDELYLSYGEYALLVLPRGAEPSEENARLIYISMQP